MLENFVNPPELLEIARSGITGEAAKPASVLVLGAGIAGLVAALELRKAGHKVTVIEAQQRVGGRVLTLRSPFSEGVYAEAGAMRIPAQHRLVMAYIERYGLKLRPFKSHNDKAWAFFHRQRRPLGEAMLDPNQYDAQLAQHERGKSFEDLWAETLGPVREAIHAGGEPAWQDLQQRLQGCSLRDFLADLGWSDGAIEVYGLYAGFETLLHASAIEFFREFLAELRQATYTIDGGMDQLPNALAQDLGSSVLYGRVVTALDQDDDKVIVYSRGVAGQEIFEADYAICTLPLSVLRHIEVLQPFSHHKQRAIRNIHYEAAAKIFFEFRERFWEKQDGIYGGASVTDLAIRNIYYPEQGRDSGRGVLLASYSHGQDAHRWGALPEHERLTQALENVAEIHPVANELVECGTSVIWSQDEYAGGAYAFFQPHQERELHEHIVAPEGRYFFAGEHASLQHRWLQGAVESGLRAAIDIHALSDSNQTTLSTDETDAPGTLQDKPDNLVGGAAELDQYAKDFGSIIATRPKMALRPTGSAQIAQAMRFASSQGLSVVARGIGHSAGGQSQVDQGLVIDMTSLDSIHSIDIRNGYLEADAGVTWQALIDALLPLGVAPAVITDWLHLTLGGTISAGGVGAQSFSRGIQADAVEALELVTASGQILQCDSDINSELFNAARAGLGQFGIITRVRMRIEPAPTTVTLEHRVFDSFDAFADAVELLRDVPGIHGLLAHAVPNNPAAIARSMGLEEQALARPEQHDCSATWLYDLEVMRYHSEGEPGAVPATGHLDWCFSSRQWAFDQFVRRIPPIIERDQRAGSAPHPELAMFVPQSSAREFIGGTMAALSVEEMGGGPILLIPLTRSQVSTPLFRIPEEAHCWLFGLLRAATPDAVEGLQRANLSLYHRGLQAGGLRYPCDSMQVPASDEEWAAHYGYHWEAAEAARQLADPEALLETNGFKRSHSEQGAEPSAGVRGAGSNPLTELVP